MLWFGSLLLCDGILVDCNYANSMLTHNIVQGTYLSSLLCLVMIAHTFGAIMLASRVATTHKVTTICRVAARCADVATFWSYNKVQSCNNMRNCSNEHSCGDVWAKIVTCQGILVVVILVQIRC
jgi:hypothetical protein